LIAPAIRTRDGSTPAVAVAFEVSADMLGLRSPRNDPPGPIESSHKRSGHGHNGAIMVNDGLRSSNTRRHSGAMRSIEPGI
jgi:hypothetical protein